jgi:hypothetical protein
MLHVALRAVSEAFTIPVICLTPRGDEILDELEQWASFSSGGPDEIDGQRGRQFIVGSVEDEQDARRTLTESLDDIAPDRRQHLSF